MTLFTKCILHSAEPQDGVRVSVMSRHTLSDGKTADTRIKPSSFKKHMPSLAPSPTLIGEYYKHALPWAEFARQYLEEIRQPEQQVQLLELAKQAQRADVTLLCVEETPEHCHRKLLAEECQRLVPTINVQHK